MRHVFIQGGTEHEAREQCPWAAVVIEVEGGWQLFESVDDARTWEQQR